MTKGTIEFRAVVDDGRGIGTIWKVRAFRSGRFEWIESVAQVFGVHTEVEAFAAARADDDVAARMQAAGAEAAGS